MKEFGVFIKALVLFGSSAREIRGKHGDIDVLCVVDDITVHISPQLIEAYRVIMETLIAQTSRRLHITTLRLSTFWEYMRNGDPVGINILRDGVGLVDTGIFEPMRMLLIQGKVKPSEEAVFNYFARAPVTLNNSRWHMIQATLDLYWAVIDASHALIMKAGILPPTPAQVANVLQEEFVKKGTLHKSYPQIMNNFYVISKGILHREISDITGQEYEKYYKDAKDFVETVRKIITK